MFFRIGALGCVAALLAAGCARREAAESAAEAKPVALRKVVLQTDWFPQAEHGGFYQALAKGFYREAGLDLEILSGGPGVAIKLAVAKGQADFGMNRSDDVVMAASQGMPLLMVGAVLQHDPEALLVHDESPVKSLADLNGRTVIAPPSMTWIPYVQKKYGIRFDLTRTNYSLAIFLADKNAIQQCIVTSEPYYAAQHGVRVRTLALADDGYDPYHAIICRRELARTSPEIVRAFLAASIRGWRDYLDGDPAPANALILQRNAQMSAGQIAFSRDALITRSLVKGDAARGEGIGRISAARVERQIGVLTELKILQTPVAAAAVVTAEFLPAITTP